MLGRLGALSRERYVSPCSRVLVHAGLGEADLALAELERVARMRHLSTARARHAPAGRPSLGAEVHSPDEQNPGEGLIPSPASRTAGEKRPRDSRQVEIPIPELTDIPHGARPEYDQP